MLSFFQILGITGASGLFGSLVTLLITHFFIKSRELKSRQWEIKRNACLGALDVVDSCFANIKWGDDDSFMPDYQALEDIKEIRKTHSRLMLSCEKIESITAFEKCIGLKGIYTAGDLVPLRNALRIELGFKKIPMDLEKAWFAKNGVEDKKIRLN